MCTLSTATLLVDRWTSLQLILHLTDGSHQILQGLFLDSSVAELYHCFKEQLSFKKFEISSTCQVSGASLKNALTNANESLCVFINLKGAGHDTPDTADSWRAKFSQLKYRRRNNKARWFPPFRGIL